MGKQYQVKVSKKMHEVLEDGARRTGMSMAEFADHVLRMKTEGELPLAALAEETAELRQRQIIEDSKTARRNLRATMAQARVIFQEELPATMQEMLGLLRQVAARRRK